MDSDSYDSLNLKEELDCDVDIQTSNNKKDKKFWCPNSTIQLIESLKNDCRELWDPKHPLNKDRLARTARHEYLAEQFETTPEEISRKIHNLRTQFNNELRKIKRRMAATEEGVGGGGGAGTGTAARGGWEYFDALSFLLPAPSADPLDNNEGVNVALAEFQANEEFEFAAAAARTAKIQAEAAAVAAAEGEFRAARRKMSTPRSARAPPSLPSNPLPMLWPEEASPRIRPIDSMMNISQTVSTDECQIFGDFVASELRSLRDEEMRKKLKRIIQKAILEVAEQEDGQLFCGHRV